MKISFNAPFTLIFTLLAILASSLNVLTNGETAYHFFSVYSPIGIDDPFSILRLFTHTLGHADWAHLTSNFSIILLIGPLVESSYGFFRLFLMTLVTAAVTGFLHIFLFDSALMGASGIAFMLILLGSLTNTQRGSIPVTFILISLIYMGNELISIFQQDNISQLAHIIGGFCGAIFGFLMQKRTPHKQVVKETEK